MLHSTLRLAPQPSTTGAAPRRGQQCCTAHTGRGTRNQCKALVKWVGSNAGAAPRIKAPPSTTPAESFLFLVYSNLAESMMVYHPPGRRQHQWVARSHEPAGLMVYSHVNVTYTHQNTDKQGTECLSALVLIHTHTTTRDGTV